MFQIFCWFIPVAFSKNVIDLIELNLITIIISQYQFSSHISHPVDDNFRYFNTYSLIIGWDESNKS